MKIDYQDHGVTAKNTGFFIMKSALTGKTPVVMRAYKVALQEMAR